MGFEPMVNAPAKPGRRRRRVRVLAGTVTLIVAAGLVAAGRRQGSDDVVRLSTTGQPAAVAPPFTEPDVAPTTTADPTSSSTATTTTTTTAVRPTVKVALPPVTLPALPRLLPTSTTTMTTAPAASPGGERCGTPSGYGDLGATRAVTQGTTTITLEVYACEHYAGEFTQNFVHVAGPDIQLRAVHLDFGDGSATDVGVYRWPCTDPSRPDPYTASGPSHTYTTAGAYPVTATVTTASCAPTDGSAPAEQTTTVSLTTYQLSGPRPTSTH
jgi:hypothetical protein